jgi:hypothetical protein
MAWARAAVVVALMGARIALSGQHLRVQVPELHHDVDVTFQVEAQGAPVGVRMVLPQGDGQTIRSEALSSGAKRTSIERKGENG